MAIPLIQPTKNPGEFVIPALGNKPFKLVEWREDDYYDTVSIAAGAVAAGTQLVFFRDIQNKQLQHCNLTNPSRIPSGAEMVLNRVGLVIGQAFGNVPAFGDDILKIAYGASFTFTINQTRIVSQGPVFKFQSGYGITGSTTDNQRNSFTTGVPSAAAAPQLLVAQPISSTDDLYGLMRFDTATGWQAGYTMPTLASAFVGITAVLHGLIKKAVAS